MKKIFFLMALFLSLSIISCKSDDSPEDTPITENQKWEPKSILISNGLISYPMDYPHSAGCAKDYLDLVSNDNAKFFHYAETTCEVTEYSNAFQRTGNNVTLNVMGYSIKGKITSETSTSMEIQSEISEYIPYIKVMLPEYEQYLSILDGGTAKLLLTKK
ncbi:MAG TPA: hypothetical protein VLY87_00390 [Flavobacterium sp.]|nr:hypothetical protein [Flavobacterium sp.]